jgi:hypothetical protein
MSVLLETTHLVTADGGILDLINGKAVDVKTTVKLVAGAGVLVYFAFATFKGGFTVGKMIMNALLVGFFLYILGAPEFFADKTDAELNNSGPVLSVTHSPHGGSDGPA